MSRARLSAVAARYERVRFCLAMARRLLASGSLLGALGYLTEAAVQRARARALRTRWA